LQSGIEEGCVAAQEEHDRVSSGHPVVDIIPGHEGGLLQCKIIDLICCDLFGNIGAVDILLNLFSCLLSREPEDGLADIAFRAFRPAEQVLKEMLAEGVEGYSPAPQSKGVALDLGLVEGGGPGPAHYAYIALIFVGQVPAAARVLADGFCIGDYWDIDGFSWGIGTTYEVVDNVFVFADYLNLAKQDGFKHDTANVNIDTGIDAYTVNIGLSYKF